MLSTVDKSVADDLSRRLCVVEKIWEDLEDQLSIRGAELRFEKTQLVCLCVCAYVCERVCLCACVHGEGFEECLYKLKPYIYCQTYLLLCA